MTITQLEYLVAVDTYHSFAGAAKECNVTQPTLSMQIKKVEKDLGVLIFDRSKKPVITTEIGKKVIKQARITLQESYRIKEIIQFQKDEIEGELSIGIIPTLSPYLLPLFITNFMEKYPEVNLKVEELLTDQIVHKLNNDLIDVGICVTPINEKSLIEMPMFYERFAVYISASHPLSKQNKINFKDLDINDMWLLREGHCFRSQSINICGDEVNQDKMQLRFESGSIETLLRIVEKQYGYTLIPEMATFDFHERRKSFVRDFTKPHPIREVSLIIHRSFMKRKLIDLLKEEILAVIPKEMKDENRGKLITWT